MQGPHPQQHEKRNEQSKCFAALTVHPAQLHEASFGAASAATVNLNNGYIKPVSPYGPGVACNFWTDGNSAFNNMGSGYLAALQAMNAGSLRYPGGEKSDTCAALVQFTLGLTGKKSQMWGRCGDSKARAAQIFKHVHTSPPLLDCNPRVKAESCE